MPRKLPYIVVDTFVDWTFSGLSLVNCVPENTDTGVSKSTTIQFTLMNTALPNTIDTSTLTIYVNGTRAYYNSANENSFVTTQIGSNPALEDITYETTPPSDFSSEEVVTVRIVCSLTGAAGSIDETYSFTVEDFIQPKVDSAIGWAPLHVRVTFDEAMDATTVENTNLYSLSHDAEYRGLYTPTISSADYVSTTVVDLVLSYPCSPDAEYMLTVSDSVTPAITDMAGNGIDPSNNTATFTAFDFRDSNRVFDGWKIYKQLSDFDRGKDLDRNLEKFCSSLQNQIDYSLLEIDELRKLVDPDRCSENFLDNILYDLQNPLDFITTRQQKLRCAWNVASLNKKKGTAPGIELGILVVLGYTCSVVNSRNLLWRLGYSKLGVATILGGSDSDPFDFWLSFSSDWLTVDELELAKKTAKKMKSINSHFLGIINPDSSKTRV